MRAKLQSFFVGDGLTARAGRSTVVVALKIAGSQALRLGGNLILTRLLFPEAFGLMALVAVVTSGLTLLSDIGINVSIVQSDRQDRAFLDTAWTMQVMRGVFLWLLACGLAVPFARIYEAPQLAAMIPVAALSLVIAGFNTTKLATLHRELTMGRTVGMHLSSQAVGLVVMVGLAMATGSVWSLILGGLVTPAVNWALTWFLLAGPSNRFHLERAAFVSIVHFGKWVMLGSLATFASLQGDRIILGRYLSLGDLGLYGIAMTLAQLPHGLVSALAGTLMLPLYRTRPPKASASNRRKTGMARALFVGGGAVALVFTGLIGNWLVEVLYDPRYAAAGAKIVVLAPAMGTSLFALGYGAAMLAAGRSRDVTIYGVTLAVVKVLGMTAGLTTMGLPGLILAIWGAPLLVYPMLARFAAREGAWQPRVDAAVFALSTAGGALAVWVNWPAVAPVLGL